MIYPLLIDRYIYSDIQFKYFLINRHMRQEGWAIPEPPRRKRFTPKQKNWLKALFEAGQSDPRKKPLADKTEELMRCSKKNNGRYVFNSHELLTSAQIGSYLNRLEQQVRKEVYVQGQKGYYIKHNYFTKSVF